MTPEPDPGSGLPSRALPPPVPGIREQWAALPVAARVVSVVVPLIVVVVAFVANVTAGAVIAVFVVGSAAATLVFVKNRSDRINAAVRAEAQRAEAQRAEAQRAEAQRAEERGNADTGL